jgi:hypothetical protein
MGNGRRTTDGGNSTIKQLVTRLKQWDAQNNQAKRARASITGGHSIPGGMIKPGMVVIRRMGRISRQEPQLVIEQHEWQRQRKRQIGEQRSDQQDAMRACTRHNRVTVFPYAPRACGRMNNISSSRSGPVRIVLLVLRRPIDRLPWCLTADTGHGDYFTHDKPPP